MMRSKLESFKKSWHALINSHREPIPALYFEQAQAQLQRVLGGIFGYYALLLSPKAADLVAGNLVIRHSLTLSPWKAQADVIGLYEALPIASDCIDLLVLPEILRYSRDPHQVLREAERVLIPDGHILLLVANPLSALGVKHRFLEKLDHRLSKTHWISKKRLTDWFALLGFEITDDIAIGGRAKWVSDGNLARWYVKLAHRINQYFASYHIIVAKKKVSTLTPIRPSWRSNPKLVGSRIADPSVTQEVDNWMSNFKHQ